MTPRRGITNGPREPSRGYTRFPDDWLDSRTVRDMTFEEEGVYAQLLDASWKYVGLPATREAVERLIEKPIPDGALWVLEDLFPVAEEVPHPCLGDDFMAADGRRRFCSAGRIEQQRIQSRCGRAGRLKQDPAGLAAGSTRGVTPEREREKEKEREKGKEKSGTNVVEVPPWHPNELPSELDAPVFYRAADAWVSHRAEYKRPKWKPRTWKANLRKLAPLGAQAAAECLNLSVSNIWAGIFPEKPNGRGPSGRPKTALERQLEGRHGQS